jgi:TolB-like protein/Flp pilus assembly protein TadD
MQSTHQTRGRIRFDVFEADLRAGELRKQDVKVRLQEQPFQILQMLLEHPGEVVTRDELQKRIWPTDTFVDFEQGLYNAIKRLREALGDSPETPRYIETLPRKGYRFIGTLAASPRRIESLAVLPLENLSGDPEQDYFAEGMTESLITSLAKIGALRVTSRTSAMRYKKTDKSLPQIARELNVDAVVEGTVQRFGKRLRISAQLVYAPEDQHLWAESYDRALRDVLALQSELARAIANEIQVKLTPLDQARFGEAHPINPEAYEAYLKGRYYWNRRSGEGFGKADQCFQQAIAKDPGYAAAHAGLADCLSALGLYGFVAPQDGFGRAKGLALRALEMDPSLAEAHASLAWATMSYDYDFVAAEREFERSIELNPRYATAHEWFGWYLALMGRYEEGYSEHKRALRLDPHSSIIHTTLGFVYYFAHRFDQQIEQVQRTLELDPNFALAHCLLGSGYLQKSMHEPAIAALRRGVQLSQDAPLFLALLGAAYARAGYPDEALKILDRLNELSKQRYVPPYFVGGIYAALGQREEAFRRLETEYREHAPWMSWLKVDPRFDDLRPDPRFRDLLRRMNFPP